MTSRLVQTLIWLGCLYAAVVGAGEILILQPAPGDGQSRNARESERAMDNARQHAGKAGAGMTTIILGDEPGQKRNLDRSKEAAQDASQDAREYLRPTPGDRSDDGTTVILRTAPVRESDRLQQRARSYVTPNAPSAANAVVVRKDCVSNVSTQIGMIGEGSGATRGNVLERGTSSVDAQGQCR
jgi:hypothetical protein